MPEANGAPDYTRVVLTIHDISEQRIREREMQRLVDAKTPFLASVSHEIRTPLTAVLGYAELLKSDSGELSVTERAELLHIVCSEAQDVAYLVEDLLVAARADLGRMSVIHDAFNVDAEVTATLRSVDFEGRDIAVPAKLGRPRYAVGDPARFRQIIRNLLTNAHRYGGHRVEVQVGETPTHVTIDVIDDGEGIPAGETHRVFALFERIATPERSPESVGIGLSISRQLAEMMGGDLRYSRRNGLTSFQVRIPRTQVAVADGVGDQSTHRRASSNVH
ncbi:MAG: HAMP domain-containing histidine kinase [Acidimicrobiia bacterium]|nr:HAMP domain-containing histidine kinase [Acidimicrobiia bacterium]